MVKLMKKKNFIIIIVIMLIFIGLCFLTVYKLKKYNKNYNIIKLSDEIVESNINFKEEYEEYIVDSSYFTSINFPINIDKHIVYYIFEKKENNLYIKNTDTNEEKKLLDEKIKSFSLVTNDETDEFMYLYLITEEGNFYKIKIISHKPIKLNIEKLNKKIKVDSFLTGVEYDTYRGIPNYSIPVFDTNYKIYIMPRPSLCSRGPPSPRPAAPYESAAPPMPPTRETGMGRWAWRLWPAGRLTSSAAPLRPMDWTAPSTSGAR